MHKTSLNGYVDHYWNGVTTSAMAKIFRGIVELDAFNKGIHHLVPINLVSKYELLTMFQELLGAEVQVEPVGGPSGPKDRTLSTIEPEVSNRLWHIGGYANIPSILTLVEEMISDYRQRSVDAEK
jgi:dTDP-4-dehydrorhamnose reductase